jgi:hypothetical protein
MHSDDCNSDSEVDDYYCYDTSKQLKTFRVNTMPPVNAWVDVEDGVAFQRCAGLASSAISKLISAGATIRRCQESRHCRPSGSRTFELPVIASSCMRSPSPSV